MQQTTQSTHTPDAGVVNEAVSALRLFGQDLDLQSATRLLPMWHYFPKLTAAERGEVLSRFAGAAPSSEDGLNDVVEAFNLGKEIERDRVDSEALNALRRIQERLDNAENDCRSSYADGYADALDGRDPVMRATPRYPHAFRVSRPYPNGFLWSCVCGHHIFQRNDDNAIHPRLLAHVGGEDGLKLCPTECGRLTRKCVDCKEATR